MFVDAVHKLAPVAPATITIFIQHNSKIAKEHLKSDYVPSRSCSCNLMLVAHSGIILTLQPTLIEPKEAFYNSEEH